MKSRYSGLLASAGFAALSYIASAATAPSLGLAESFAVLGGTAVTITGSVVNGDVGVDVGAVTQTNSTIRGTVHEGNTVAQDAYDAFFAAYVALAFEPCVTVISGNLAGQSLPPGVYCVDGASSTTGGVLTLLGSSTDTWIFKIKDITVGRPPTITPGILTGINFTVVGMTPSGETWTCNNNVFWWTSAAATLTDSVLIGNILAGTDITVTGGSLGGQVLAIGAVTLTGTSINVCDTPPPPPIKVTGGGQIPLPELTSKGRATFGFNAQPNTDGTATGHFNYVNHVTGLHVDGPVNAIVVIATNLDGSPKTVQFSGTGVNCLFTVTVEDNGEPGKTDRFGIKITTVTGETIEDIETTVINQGNIQFHKP